MLSLIRPFKLRAASRRLKKIDINPIPEAPDEIRLFMKVRNESIRLPFICQYYFSRGVDRMFIIDHGSTDGTRAFLFAQKNTHVFQVADRYDQHPYWFDALLCQYGVGHWCVVVDADEVLIYPECERLTLRKLCAFIEEKGCNALNSILLDMYPGKPMRDVSYMPGGDPLSIAPYFDAPQYYINKYGYPYGGVRERIFRIRPCLSKFPLFRFDRSLSLSAGAHYLKGADLARGIRGAVLHFKFLNNFHSKVAEEVKRKEYWRNAVEYRAYSKVLKRDPELNFYHPGSIRYSNSDQLVALGIMKSSQDFEDYVRTTAEK